MGINFDLNDLQAFRAVAELGSFRKAAAALNISQPALSRRIDKLEQALGVRVKLLNSSANDVLASVISGEADFGVSFI